MATMSASFLGIGGSHYDPLASLMENYINGKSSDYWAQKAEKRAYKRQLDLMNEQYRFAQRYAENSPSWNIQGLRNSGLNPILAISNGAQLGSNIPSVPNAISYKGDSGSSSSSQSFKLDPIQRKQYELLSEQVKGQQIKNKNEAMNRGLSGQYGAYSRLLSEAQSGFSTRPDNYDKVMDGISNALNSFGSFLKNSPHTLPKETRTEYQSALRASSEDTPPSMKQNQKFIDYGNGFNSRDYHRSKHKIDDIHLFRKRQPWEKIYRW